MLAHSQSKSPATDRQPPSLQTFLARHAATIRWCSLGLLLVSAVLLMRVLPTQQVLGMAEEWIDSLGMWGPLALGLIYIVAVLLLVPGSMLTLVIGAAYGLVLGTIVVSIASTTAAALAFLIARYIARDKVRRRIERSPKLAAVDQAIGEQGWKIVVLLRLSPAVPFNLQNYLYGVTAIRFWPCVLASWVAMLPGTFLYVYLGSLGKTAAAGGATSGAEWLARGVGLVATIALTVYVAKLAREAIKRRTHIDDAASPDREQGHAESASASDEPQQDLSWPWSAILTTALAVAVFALALWATVQRDAVRSSVERLLGMPPTIPAVEASAARRDGTTFDHSTCSGPPAVTRPTRDAVSL